MTSANLKIVRPSSSYQLELPEKISEQMDGRVASFWVDGEPLLLQLSSYIRGSGEQVRAKDRLVERLGKHDVQWTEWMGTIHPDQSIDQATAEFTDRDGFLWIHSYLVWPHLTVYSTISGPKKLLEKHDDWAIRGLRSIRLTIH